MSLPPDRHRDLVDVWPGIDTVPGWLTRAQAARLWSAVAAADPEPTVVEIGCHHGRSTLVLASARDDATVVAVDPFVTARLFPGRQVRDALETNLERLGVRGRVRVLETTSRAARRAWSETVDVLYIDGKHDYWTVSDDLRWVEFVRPGGPVLVHDAFSSVGVTLALLRHVMPGSSLRYAGRTGSMARFTASRPRPLDRLAMLGELPWWGRNLILKTLLRLRLRRVARSLGHDSPFDPY